MTTELKDRTDKPEEKSILKDLGEGRKFKMDGGLEFEYSPDRPEEFNLRWKTEHDKGSVTKSELWAMAFLMADEDMRQKMIPVKTQDMRVFHKVIKIKLTRDLKKGQEVVASVKFTVPVEMLMQAAQSGLFVPKKV